MVVDDVAVHSKVGGGGLGGLSEREGGGNNKYKANNVTQYMTIQYAVPGVSYRSTTRYRRRGDPSGKVFPVPDNCQTDDRRGTVACSGI